MNTVQVLSNFSSFTLEVLSKYLVSYCQMEYMTIADIQIFTQHSYVVLAMNTSGSLSNETLGCSAYRIQIGLIICYYNNKGCLVFYWIDSPFIVLISHSFHFPSSIMLCYLSLGPLSVQGKGQTMINTSHNQVKTSFAYIQHKSKTQILWLMVIYWALIVQCPMLMLYFPCRQDVEWLE